MAEAVHLKLPSHCHQSPLSPHLTFKPQHKGLFVLSKSDAVAFIKWKCTEMTQSLCEVNPPIYHDNPFHQGLGYTKD